MAVSGEDGASGEDGGSEAGNGGSGSGRGGEEDGVGAGRGGVEGGSEGGVILCSQSKGMGTTLSVVGATDGTAVGKAVGKTVGKAVGKAVGTAAGTAAGMKHSAQVAHVFRQPHLVVQSLMLLVHQSLQPSCEVTGSGSGVASRAGPGCSATGVAHTPA